MKNYRIILLFSVFIVLLSEINAQTINWAGMNGEDKNILNVNFGVEYGAIYGFSYARTIDNKYVPMVAHIEYSFASGEYLFDDIKTKMGVQVRWFEYHHFQLSTRIDGVFRRYENDYVRLVNFGSDFAGVIGYYREGWFVAGEVGFDKAIITHFKHTEEYREHFPGVVDGWYGPTTGGNFYYGLVAGYSFGKSDIYAKAGRILTQDFETSPLIPMYGQVGYNFKF